MNESMNDTRKVANLSLLLCTNGCETTRPSLQYGIWLAGLLHIPVLLLGVVEAPDEHPSVVHLLEETAANLAAAGISHQVQVDQGRGSLVIARYAKSGDFLTVFGPLGRPAWRRMVQGRSFRRLQEKIATPLLYVPQARLPLRHMLICMGGLGYAAGVERVGLFLARQAGARVTLLHVVEPVMLDYPVAKAMQHNWQDILQTDTPQGRNLRQALADIQAVGLEPDFKVRHGSPVHEILDEINHGDYDLIGMGSQYSAHSLRHFYMPNVTAEVAETAGRPVLSVRLGHDLLETDRTG